MSKVNKAIKAKLKTNIRRAFEHPRIQAIGWSIIVLIVSGIISVVIYEKCKAISAILASICAGCVTGIVFYVITNIRNNEVQSTNEEYESIKEHWDLVKKIEDLCSAAIQNTVDGEVLHDPLLNVIKDNLNEIVYFMSVMFIDLPKTTKLIKDYPKDYVDEIKQISSATDPINSKEELDKEQVLAYLCSILTFCADTRRILLGPMMELMKEVYSLEKSVI